MSLTLLEGSRALWNRSRLELRSDEQLAQIVDRGSMDDWRALYAVAKGDPALRGRIARLLVRVPLPLPHFWQAALANLGEPVDFDTPLPEYESEV